MGDDALGLRRHWTQNATQVQASTGTDCLNFTNGDIVMRKMFAFLAAAAAAAGAAAAALTIASPAAAATTVNFGVNEFFNQSFDFDTFDIPPPYTSASGSFTFTGTTTPVLTAFSLDLGTLHYGLTDIVYTYLPAITG